MARMRVRSACLLAVLWIGCGGGSGSTENELRAYCAVAQRADLDAWANDVVTECRSASDDVIECTAGRVSASGEVTAIAIAEPFVRVLAASNDRYVVLLADERLVIADDDGAIGRVLASWASDPWISDDGERVAWIGLPDGVDAWDFGVPTVIAVQDIDDAERTIVAQDDLAGAPRPIPGTRDVLYASSQSGLASFWMAGPDLGARQVTNLGLTEIGQDSVPIAGRQLAWSSGTLYYGVTGESATTLWRLVLGNGITERLGDGAWPHRRSDGAVLAAQRPGSSACAAVYGGAP